METRSGYGSDAAAVAVLRVILRFGSLVTSRRYPTATWLGGRPSLTDKDGRHCAYGHDPGYRMMNETAWTNKVPGSREYQLNYVYDVNGNRIIEHINGVGMEYVYGDNNEMLEAGNAAFTYDHFGNTKTKTVGVNVTTYHYDFESHLTKIEYPSGPDDDHQYDGNGMRMRSKLAGATDWNNFIHDPLTGDLIAEYTLIEDRYQVHAVYTYGIGLISAVRNTVKRYFHYDGSGSTWALTDYDEVVQETFAWSSFGQMESPAPLWVEPFPFLFGGQGGLYDDMVLGSQSGLQYYDGSYFSPEYGIVLMSQSPLDLIKRGIDWVLGRRSGPPELTTTEKLCIQLSVPL